VFDQLKHDLAGHEWTPPPDEDFEEPTPQRLPDGRDLIHAYHHVGVTPNAMIYDGTDQGQRAMCGVGVICALLGVEDIATKCGTLLRNILAGESGVPQHWVQAWESGLMRAASDISRIERGALPLPHYPDPRADREASYQIGYDAWVTVHAELIAHQVEA